MNSKQHDFLVQLKNAAIAQRVHLKFLYNKKLVSLAFSLYKEGLIQSFFVKNGYLFIVLRSFLGQNCLSYIKLLSKPTYKNHLNYRALCNLNIRGGAGLLSTDRGVESLNFCRINRIGGKGLFVC
jgi:ribosomal protein S8